MSVTVQGPKTRASFGGMEDCVALDLFEVDSCLIHLLGEELAG